MSWPGHFPHLKNIFISSLSRKTPMQQNSDSQDFKPPTNSSGPQKYTKELKPQEDNLVPRLYIILIKRAFILKSSLISNDAALWMTGDLIAMYPEMLNICNFFPFTRLFSQVLF